MNKQKTWIRWGIIVGLVFILFLALIFKLYELTMIRGEELRNLSEVKRMKEIEITAPRGNIFDSKGRLLAGTRTSFTIQAYKDDLMGLEQEDRNETLEQLIHYMERDGGDYLTSYPISINAFVFQSDADYFKEEESPSRQVENALKKHKLLSSWLSMVYTDPKDGYKVSVAARALDMFSLKGSKLPIIADPDKDFELRYVEGKELDEYKKLHDLRGVSPLDLLADAVSSNQNILSRIMDHPAARFLAYDLVKDYEDMKHIALEPYIYSYEEEFKQTKGSLHQYFDKITMKSTAQKDFVEIVKNVALDNFLTSLMVKEDNKFLIPAEKIINSLEEKDVESNLSYKIEEDANSIEIVYEQEEETLEIPLDRLKRLAKEYDLLDQVIVDENYKEIAEKAMFEEGFYPGISIYSWQYGLTKSQEDFLDRFDLEKERPKEAFQKIKKEYSLEKDNEIVNLGILVISDRVRAQGAYAYAPVNICYELSPMTVAQVEENIPPNKGLRVSKEPIRYYPYGDSACHILGYLGKISTDWEIEKYIDEKGYLPSELIGKTGVEESFEDTLHGVNGKEVVLIDSYGNRKETLERVDPKPGNNLYLTIDIELQKRVEKSLKNSILSIKHGMQYQSPWGKENLGTSPAINSGASASVDPNTGELLAMASYPSFDPNLFVTGISSSDWKNLMPDENAKSDEPRPLMNLASQTAVQPGSTFKLLTALTALDKGLGEDDLITCDGYIDIGDTRFNCLIWTMARGTHGPINVKQAIGVSCNYFFYTLGLGKDPKGHYHPGIQTNVDDIHAMAKRLGLDTKSGLEINYPMESKNAIPSREGKLELSQALLKYFLDENLEKYKKEGYFKNSKDIEEDIKTIVSWASQSQLMTRQQVLDSLEELGYYSEKPLSDSYTGLGDILKYNYLNQASWTVSDSMNIVIGQGQAAFTPLGMLRLVTEVANGGYNYRFSLVKSIRSHDEGNIIYEQKPEFKRTDLAEDHFRVVRDGMKLAAIENAKTFRNIPFEIGVKTGTAEREGISPTTGMNYPDYSWCVAFAPFDDPKIATVTFLPSAGFGMYSIPVSRDSIAQYLKVKKSDQEDGNFYGDLKTYYPLEDKDE